MVTRNPGIYIHIPFCLRKCNYCAFLSAPADDAVREQYVQALVREIELYKDEMRGRRFDTVYMGGGTPSLLSASQVKRILDAVRANFNIDSDAEITLEANPRTLGDNDEEIKEKLSGYRSSGVNRLSMGVQSMDDDRLKFLGRIHSSSDVIRDFRIARECGFDNINLDLITGVPGMTLGDALSDVERIVELHPEHISFYSLQLEEGTPLYQSWENEEFEEIPDELDREMYHRGCELLAEAGYEHYEISNFSLPGRESRHNSKYWNMAEYLGLGLGSSGFSSGSSGDASTVLSSRDEPSKNLRYMNSGNLEEYMRETAEGRKPVAEMTHNSVHDDVSEAAFTGLRRREGIRFSDIEELINEGTKNCTCNGGTARYDGNDSAGRRTTFREYYEDVWEDLEEFRDNGYLIIDNDGMRLTAKGIDVSNRIMTLLV